jgi:signal transduction histidine kinase
MISHPTDTSARFLADLGKQLGRSLDLETTIETVVRAGVPELADWCVVDLVEEDASLRRVAAAHVDPQRDATAHELAARHALGPTTLEGVAGVVRGGNAVLIDVEEHPLFVEFGAESGIIAPMLAGDTVVGALSLGAVRPFCETDLELAVEFASRCAQAIDNARLYRRALQATELRDSLLAAISHDLKNPLATIGAQGQLLARLADADERPRTAERLRRGVHRIESTVARMSRIIDGLLDVTRLELTGHLQLARVRMDLVDVAKRLVMEHQERAPRHRIVLAGETSLVGEWDQARMERVVDNLIGNAVKYSPAGGVVTVICATEMEPDAWAILSVRDEGVGVPEADLGRIFERFHRASNVGGIAGTGIGLATTRDVVEQHGGTITVDSREGRGSTFTIRLPISARNCAVFVASSSRSQGQRDRKP